MKYIKNKFCLSTFLFFIIAIFSTANAQEIYTLQYCLKTGLEKNYGIQIVRNEQKISDNNASLGNAGYLPTLDLNAGYSGALNNSDYDYFSGESTHINNNLTQTVNAGLNLNWMVFDGFKIQANYERLKELQKKGELNTRLTLEDFAANLSMEYYNYIQQNIRLKNLKSAVALSRERLRIVEARYKIGSLSRLDLQQATVDFNADSSSLVKQTETLYRSAVRLNHLMAVEEVSQPFAILDTTINLNYSLTKDSLWEQIKINNTSLLLAIKDKSLSELDYKMIKSRNYPYLKLNAGYGYTLNTFETGTYERQQNLGLNYGLTLGFNIFDGMNRRREQRNAQLAVENVEIRYEQLELSIKADFTNLWMSYETYLNLIGLERSNLEVAKENHEIAIDRYKLGDLSGIELREAQNSLLEAENRLLAAEYNTKLCEISLQQLSGEILKNL